MSDAVIIPLLLEAFDLLLQILREFSPKLAV